MSVYSLRLLFLLMTFFIVDSFAQAPGDVLWVKYYGGDLYDEANAVVNAHDSGYVFVGSTQSYGLGRWSNAFIGKTNSQGDSLFTRHFGGAGMDVLTDVIQTSDGNYLTVGLSDSETDFEQVYIVKFDDRGDTLWTKAYGGGGKEIAYSVLQTNDNGFIISAVTTSSGAGGEDVWILKTNSTGDTLWTKTYGTPGGDAAFDLCATSDSSFAFTGIMDNSSLMVLKVNDSGDSLWLKTFHGSNFEEGTAIVEASNNELMVLGHTSSFGAGDLDIYLVCVNSDGDSVFTKTFGSAFYEEGRDIIKLNNNEFIIGGNTTQNSSSNTMDYYIISVDSLGETNWSKIIGTQNPERCYDLFNTEDGNFLIAGSNSLSGLEDAALTLIKGDIGTSVNDETTDINSFILHEAYPNPFNPSTNIKYTIPQAANISIKVYGILGNLIGEIVNEYMNPGTYTVKFNSSEYNLSSGVYFYTIRAGSFVSTKKMVLTK